MLIINKVENGFIVNDTVTSKMWVAKGYYDVTDVVREVFKEDED
jgi:hypothetical protein